MSVHVKIKKACMKSPFGTKKYLPESKLEEILTREAILKELHDAKIYASDDLLKYIYQRAKRLFAILICIDLRLCIEDFSKYDLDDTNLPIVLKPVAEDSYQAVPFNDGHRSGRNELEAFKKWNSANLSTFEDTQYRFLAPIIRDDNFKYTIHEECPLPVIEADFTRDSYFSKVYKAKLDFGQSTQRLGDIESPASKFWAIKELKPSRPDHGSTSIIGLLSPEGTDEDRFDQEANSLEETRTIIRQRKGVRIVQAIAAIRTHTGNSFYFIFPWAEEGNLSDVWAKDDTPNLSEARITWFLEEIAELSLAIRDLHDGNPALPTNLGMHGDLKPENILCFLGEGSRKMLYVADMGLVRFHSISTGDRSIPTRTIQGTLKYCPPEELSTIPSERKRSRSYDIWSMGCIYLEFVVWLLYGFDNLKDWKSLFNRFYSVNPTRLDHQVRTWMQHMRNTDPRCSKGTALGEVLELIETRLLVIEQGNRAQATEMLDEIQRIGQRAKRERAYCFKGPATFDYPGSALLTQQSLGPMAQRGGSREGPRSTSIFQVRTPDLATTSQGEPGHVGQVPEITINGVSSGYGNDHNDTNQQSAFEQTGRVTRLYPSGSPE